MCLRYFVFITIVIHLSLANECVKSITEASGSKSGNGQYCSRQLIFEDNFDILDSEKWQHEVTLGGGGNWEFQWYVDNRKNSFTKNGKLHLRPTLTSEEFGEDFLTSGVAEIPQNECTDSNFFGCRRQGTPTNIINPIRSARVHTKDLFYFKYGTLEIRAKLPTGDWLWPAIWLLPQSNEYGGWPRSGEIDLMESRGNRDLREGNVNIGVEQFGSTLHFGSDPGHDAWQAAHYLKNSPSGQGFDKEFHVYKLTWTPEYLKFYVDDAEVGTVNVDQGFFKKGQFPENPWSNGSKMAPFDEPFYIILNLAVGGLNGYFPDSGQNPQAKPWKNNSPQAAKDFWDGRSDWLSTWKYYDANNDDRNMEIDYVRVYAL